MAPPSPITCRPSAARHPLLLRARAPRVHGAARLGLGRALPPTREPLVAARGVAAAAEPWSSPRVWPSRSSRAAAAARCAAAGQQVAGRTGVGRGAGMEVALASAAVVAMATGNRVLYKLALVPLREYPFFLAQFATVGCVRTSTFLLPRFAPRIDPP